MKRVISSRKQMLFFITSIAALCGLLFGYDTGIIAGAMIFITRDFALTTFAHEVVVSIVLLGAAIGAGISGRLTDMYGRRRLMLVAAMAFFIGTLISALAPHVVWIVVGRLIVGFAIGVASYAAPLYISEVAPKDKRGALVIVNTIMVTGGIVVAYIIALSFAHYGSWRWMFGLGIIPAILLGLGVLALPDSPRWLAKHDLMTKAFCVLQRIRSQAQAEAEIKEIQINIAQEEKVKWSHLFSSHVRILLVVGIGLAIIQQISGINTILYYAPVIFQVAGFPSTLAQLLATLGMGITNFVFTIIAMIWVDHIGRRRLLLIGLAVTTVCMLVTSFAFNQSIQTPFMRWLTVIGLIVFVAFYAISIGCLFWLIISEIFPLNVRGLAMSICAMANWIANLIIALSFLSLLKALGPSGTFLVYAGAGFISWLFSYFLVPETKQVSLEQIEENLRAGKRARDIGQPLK